MQIPFGNSKYRHHSHDTRAFYDREKSRSGSAEAERRTDRALSDATFHRGPLAGRTGDPFKDKPFFNPWAPGGTFNKRGRR